MRTFYVVFRTHLVYGEYSYNTTFITLNENEKANLETFNKKINEEGGLKKFVMSWSLNED